MKLVMMHTIRVMVFNFFFRFFFSQIRTTKGKMVLSSASEAITSVVPIERRLEVISPILSMRIIKNHVEANGIREAHRRDGAAIVQYLYWLETEINDQNITEMKGAEKLKDFKRYTRTKCPRKWIIFK